MSLSAKIHADREARRARQAAKPQKVQQTVMNPAYVYGMFNLALGRANKTMTDKSDVDQLTEGPLVQLERLRTGTLNDGGFIELCEAVEAAAELANEIWLVGTADTRALLEEIKPELLVGKPVLQSLAERGRYVCKGDELQILRVVIGRYAELIAVADRGAVCRALHKAVSNTKKAFSKQCENARAV